MFVSATVCLKILFFEITFKNIRALVQCGLYEASCKLNH